MGYGRGTNLMSRESRSAIPGRTAASLFDEAEDRKERSLDKLMFGDREAPTEEETVSRRDAEAKRLRAKLKERHAAANDDAVEAKEEIPQEEDIKFVERAARDRRGSSTKRTSDRRRNGYSRLPDERGNYAAEGSKRGPVLLAIAGVIVLVFGAVVWNAYRDGVRTEETSITPNIAGGPFKEPGAGLTQPAGTRSEDAAVFGSVGGSPVEAAPEPEPPAGVLAGPPTAPSAIPSPAASVAPSPSPSIAASPVAALSPAPSASASTAPRPAASPSAPPRPVASPSAAAPRPVASPSAAAPSPAPARSAAPAPAAVPAGAYAPHFAPTGGFVVQMASVTSEAAAEQEWARRSRTAPELFGSAEKSIVRADVNGQTRYRLRAGAFATRADANAFCQAFTARGGTCLVAAK
jgi:hypothetical protein